MADEDADSHGVGNASIRLKNLSTTCRLQPFPTYGRLASSILNLLLTLPSACMPFTDDGGGFELALPSAVSKLVSCPAASHLMVEFYVKLPTRPWNSIPFYSNDAADYTGANSISDSLGVAIV